MQNQVSFDPENAREESSLDCKICGGFGIVDNDDCPCCRGSGHKGDCACGDKEKMLEENQDIIECRNCRVIVAVVEGKCRRCGEEICIVCGCTENAACPGGCYWTRPNVCSQCDAETAGEF